MQSLLVLIQCLVAQAAGNPFLVSEHWFVNPVYKTELAASISNASSEISREKLETLSRQPTAFWIDAKSKISGRNNSFESILDQAGTELIVAVVYNLPNRDCSAEASAGEICCAYLNDSTCDWSATTCDTGIAEYDNDYIDKIVTLLNAKPSANVVLLLEPDALPNLATNTNIARCGNATQEGYKEGIRYAVSELSQLNNVIGVYLDAGNGAWLGWSTNAEAYTAVLKDIFSNENDLTQNVRGFATNVANYQALGSICPWESTDGIQNQYCLNGNHEDDNCCNDPCGLLPQYNPANNELNYVATLNAALRAAFPVYSPGFIIDTARNGVEDSRDDCSDWCNVRGAGLGPKPTNVTANSSLIDAYLYIKTPGESDGCTKTLPDGSSCGARYDSSCTSQDSVGSKSGEPRAPEAGQWFEYHIELLVNNSAW